MTDEIRCHGPRNIWTGSTTVAIRGAVAGVRHPALRRSRQEPDCGRPENCRNLTRGSCLPGRLQPAFAENLMRLHVTIASLIWAIASLLFAVMGQKTANVWLFLRHLDLQKARAPAAASSLLAGSLQMAQRKQRRRPRSQWAKRLSSAGRPAAPGTRATPATIGVLGAAGGMAEIAVEPK